MTAEEARLIEGNFGNHTEEIPDTKKFLSDNGYGSGTNYTTNQVAYLIREFATLHAQKIADKMVEELTPSNEQIHEAALAWARDHSEAPDKDCPTWLIRDYEAGAYFVRQCMGCWNKTDNLKSREK